MIHNQDLSIKERKCHKTCLVRKAVEEDNPLDSLMKMRLHFPPSMPLCFQTGVIQACLERWDLFMLILPCSNQTQWMKYRIDGDSLLQIAANQNNTEMIETLILWYGLPKVDLGRIMYSVLKEAVGRGQTEVVRRLIHLQIRQEYLESGFVSRSKLINIALKKGHHGTVHVLETITPVFTL